MQSLSHPTATQTHGHDLTYNQMIKSIIAAWCWYICMVLYKYTQITEIYRNAIQAPNALMRSPKKQTSTMHT